MQKIQPFFFIVCMILFSGTTYIVKQGEKELEKFNLEDGQSGEKIIQHDEVLARTERQKQADEKPAAKVETELEKPQEVSWRVKGSLVDLLRLKSLGEGEILFIGSGEGNTVKADLSKEGTFSAELPASKDSAWEIKVNPPGGYSDKVFLYSKGELEKIPFEERLRLRDAVYRQHGIRSSISDLTLAVFPLNLTPGEEEQYKKAATFEPPPVEEDPAEVEKIKNESVLFKES